MDVVCIGNGQADITSHITVEVAQTLSTMHDQLIVVIFDDTDSELFGRGHRRDLGFQLLERARRTSRN